jgi:hypothetical protein
VRLAGAGEIRFVKGQPLVTSDPNIISYVKDRPTMFGITVLKTEERPILKTEERPVPKVARSLADGAEENSNSVAPSQPPPARRQPNLRRPGSRPKSTGDDDA